MTAPPNSSRPFWSASPTGLPAAEAPRVAAIGQQLENLFLRQFAAEPDDIRFHLRLLRLVRRLFNDLCWPPVSARAMLAGSNRPTFTTGDLADEPRFTELLSELGHSQIVGPAGALTVANIDEACELLAGLIGWLAHHPLARSACECAATLHVPARLPASITNPNDITRVAQRSALRAQLANNFRTTLPPEITPILFGSMAAEGPALDYADVDLALYLPQSVAEDAAALAATVRAMRAAQPLILRLDPLQHHGPYLLLELEEPAYGEAWLPLAALRLATVLGGQALTRPVRPIEDRLFSWLSLLSAWQGVRGILARPRELADRYMAKYLTSLVLLAPALCCGALGQPVDKAESFVIFKAALAPEERQTLEAVERLRREWAWTIGLPRWPLTLVGGRTALFARTVARWPAPSLAHRLRELAPGLDQIFQAAIQIIEGHSSPEGAAQRVRNGQ